MSEQDLDVAAIVKKLKERALAHPRVPVGAPPREHYHFFPNELSMCFTLDILPEVRYWHLSIARMTHGGPTKEEIELWRQAFFEEEPTKDVPGQIPSVNSRHFFWRESV